MYNVRKDQQRINEIVSHKNIYYYLLKTPIHDMYISYIKTWIKKVSCIHIKHVKHIKKVCSLSQKWVFFTEKNIPLLICKIGKAQHLVQTYGIIVVMDTNMYYNNYFKIFVQKIDIISL